MAGVAKGFPTPAGWLAVLRGVDLSIQPGEFVVVTGPSGSGKTTLLNLAGLLDRPSAGTVKLGGREVGSMGEKEMCRVRREDVGVVFQRFCLMPRRSALDNVAFRFRYLDCDPGEARTLAAKALESVGLQGVADSPARLLSAGEMQRVAIARAVARRPRLLVADEPTGNLDARSATGVMDSFRQLNRDGITVLMVTHNEGLLTYASRRLTCRNGVLE